MDDLTKEQKKLLLLMYKEVLCRQPALNFEDANIFADSDEIRDLFLPDKSSDYVSDLCWRLERKGYLYCTPGDDLANNIVLTDETIIYMENRFKNNVEKVLSFIGQLK